MIILPIALSSSSSSSSSLKSTNRALVPHNLEIQWDALTPPPLLGSDIGERSENGVRREGWGKGHATPTQTCQGYASNFLLSFLAWLVSYIAFKISTIAILKLCFNNKRIHKGNIFSLILFSKVMEALQRVKHR